MYRRFSHSAPKVDKSQTRHKAVGIFVGFLCFVLVGLGSFYNIVNCWYNSVCVCLALVDVF